MLMNPYGWGRASGAFEELARVAAEVGAIETVVPEPTGIDDTNAIQGALDNKGLVRIIHPGTYFVGRLQIDSDTTFVLDPGVILRKKAGTNSNMLVNKGHLTDARNKNITIIGGTWDANSAENQTPAADSHLCCILMHGVDGLKISDVEEIGNELKYCYLIADCTNIECRNIRFNNGSDGLHFQPPIYNLLVENITGHTSDDMVSFTMGDYPAYAVGVTGDIENVLVRNICSDATTAEHVKMVGDGLNHTSVFRNIRVENVRGGATHSSICILQKDQTSQNDYLNNTHLENIVFSNIHPDVTGLSPAFFMNCSSGDITIEDSIWDTASRRFIQVVEGEGGIIDKLTVRNIKCIGPAPTDVWTFLRCQSTMTIKQLNIVDCIIDLATTVAGYFIYSTDNSILRTNIDNSTISIGYDFSIRLMQSDGTSAAYVILRCSNSRVQAGLLGYFEGVKTRIFTNNCDITVGNALTHIMNNATVRLETVNNRYTISNGLSSALDATHILSLNGIDVPCDKLLSQLSPIEGDIVRAANAGETNGKGLYYYNGAAWVKYAG